MRTEIWKDIPNLEGIYQVSDMGNVRSIDRICQPLNCNPYLRKGKNLKPHLNNRGYYSVNIGRTKGRLERIHTLVAMAFLNHAPNGMNVVIDHIDNNKLNNDLSNLQLTNQRHNSSKDKVGGYSKYVGVSFDKSRGRWFANICIDKKQKTLGRFNCELAAAYAYNVKLKGLNYGRVF